MFPPLAQTDPSWFFGRSLPVTTDPAVPLPHGFWAVLTGPFSPGSASLFSGYTCSFLWTTCCRSLCGKLLPRSPLPSKHRKRTLLFFNSPRNRDFRLVYGNELRFLTSRFACWTLFFPKIALFFFGFGSSLSCFRSPSLLPRLAAPREVFFSFPTTFSWVFPY